MVIFNSTGKITMPRPKRAHSAPPGSRLSTREVRETFTASQHIFSTMVPPSSVPGGQNPRMPTHYFRDADGSHGRLRQEHTKGPKAQLPEPRTHRFYPPTPQGGIDLNADKMRHKAEDPILPVPANGPLGHSHPNPGDRHLELVHGSTTTHTSAGVVTPTAPLSARERGDVAVSTHHGVQPPRSRSAPPVLTQK